MSNQIIAETSIDVNEAPRQAENAQQTADKAFSGVGKINDPNQLGPAEKQELRRKYQTDKLAYDMDIKTLMDAGLPTAELQNAMNALDSFITPYFKDMGKTEQVDRDRLNQVFNDFDTADKNASNAFNNVVSNAAKGAKEAGEQASAAASDASVQASVAVSNANAAQSSAMAAANQAGFASDTSLQASQTASSAVATANEAAAGVTAAKSDAANALTSAATALNAANGAKDSAGTALSNAQNALDKVNGMQIGGTNLLCDTEFTEDGHPHWQGPVSIDVTDTYLGHKAVSFDETSLTGSDFVDFQQVIYSSNIQVVKLGEWYTLSFYAKGSGKFISYVYPLTIDTNAGEYVDGKFVSPAQPDGNQIWALTNDWVRHTFTFKINQSISTDANALKRVLWRFYAGAKVSICMPQLEMGNVASDYSQSPLDVQVQISDINGELQKKVSKDTYDALAGTVDQVSTLSKQNQSALVDKVDSQTVDTLKQRVTKAENTLTQTATETELQQTKTDVDKLNNSVNTNASNITAQAGKIDGLLSSATDINDNLTKLEGSFDLSSKQLSTTMSKVNSMTSGGGTNLIANSVNDIIADDTIDKNGWCYRLVYEDMIAGQQYTFSSDVTVNTGNVTQIRMRTMDDGLNSDGPGENVDIVNGHISWTFIAAQDKPKLLVYAGIDSKTAGNKVTFHHYQLETGIVAHDWSPAPEDLATVTALTQVKQTADGAQVLATNNHGDITSLQETAKVLQSTVSDKVSSDQLTQLSDQLTNKITTASNDASSKMVQTINSAGVGFKNPDGTTYTFSLSAGGTALLDFNKIMLNGQTNIKSGTIGTAQIADAAITNAKIANLDASKITTGIMDASHINVDQLIANGINGKTIAGITVNTPTLNLGLNGQFTESYNYTQDTSWFLPKKASGDVTFNHGVIEDQGTMQSYVNGTWGAINDSSVFTSGMTNNVWTEYAPGYYKIDMYKQGSTSNVLQRTYADPTGYYYTDAAGDKSYLGNVLQTPQVQTGSLFSTTLNQMPGDLRMRVVANGSDWGLQVGSYSGSEAVLSDFIYNFTSSRSSNVYITANGHLSRSTSASKYKYNIKHAIDEDSLADKLLTMHVSTWNDKHAVDSYAQTLTDNTKSEDISIKDNYGLIAEDLRDAGLDMFVEYGNNHTIEGIEYDRAWLPLLPKMRQMNDKINEYELRISKLEAKK
ncbi:hypothetical protein [Pediococcus parvulus]|uniref:hypothetical protein n=1 Tax=Pediococcus parvulus TaxID=54062 RepID=UPI00345F0750